MQNMFLSPLTLEYSSVKHCQLLERNAIFLKHAFPCVFFCDHVSTGRKMNKYFLLIGILIVTPIFPCRNFLVNNAVVKKNGIYSHHNLPTTDLDENQFVLYKY
jgi:hypothetical protein